ncbi:MAG: hypothetical protein KF749_16825 [Bacteroidetes bacterium]|nr:hypothetical protein [Bacteroidota bacterium]MCW5895568.1 hypothetical protein [Bacteroidota bacterium]
MPQEYSGYLHNAASLSREFGKTFSGIRFDSRDQAVEVFVLQALAMCASHCDASAILLENGFKGEAVTTLRPVQELLFDMHWILQTNDRGEQLERVYRLEADPYAHWDKETKLIERHSSTENAKRMRGSLDDLTKEYPFLTQTVSDGTTEFKTAPSFACRMGAVRPRFYHIYCYSSVFSHPTPFVKNLYLKTSDSDGSEIEAIDESVRQFIAYTLLFVELIMGYAEECLGSFASSSRTQRDSLYSNVVGLVKEANRGYFSSVTSLG